MRNADIEKRGPISKILGCLGVLGLLFGLVVEAGPCLCGSDCNAVAGLGHSAAASASSEAPQSCCAREVDPTPPADGHSADRCGRCFAAPRSGVTLAYVFSVDASTLLLTLPARSTTGLPVISDQAGALRMARGSPAHSPPAYLRFHILRI